MNAQTIVIVGATGDLAKRMLFPSLYFLDSEGKLPDGFKIFGAARASQTPRRLRRTGARIGQGARRSLFQ